MDCSSFRSFDEYPGRVEYAGDQTVQSVGIDGLGAADGTSGLCDSLVFYRERSGRGTVAGREQIYCLAESWGIYHRDRDPEYGKTGPAQATMLIVIAQLVVSYLIELFGIFGVEKQPFDWKKLAGTAIVVGGIILFKWE